MSELVVVERVFEQGEDLNELRAREQRIPACFDKYAVTPVCSYLARDRKRAWCVYRAPDAEAVRTTQRLANVPLVRAWSAEIIGPAELDAALASVIVVERAFSETVTREQVRAMFSGARDCFALYRVDHLIGHLSRDGRRMLCIYAAPDAESVRLANRQAGAPLTTAWPAEHLRFPPRN